MYIEFNTLSVTTKFSPKYGGDVCIVCIHSIVTGAQTLVLTPSAVSNAHTLESLNDTVAMCLCLARITSYSSASHVLHPRRLF